MGFFILVKPILWSAFLFRLVKEFVVSCLKVSRIVVFDHNLPEDTFCEVYTRCEHPFAQMLIANFISLTPGTVSWEIAPQQSGARIGVHVLDQNEVQGLHDLVADLDKILLPIFPNGKETA